MRPAFILLLIVQLFTSATRRYQPAARPNLQLQFHHFVGSEPLLPDNSYRNHFDEEFTVTKFRYYVSNIVVGNSVSGKKHKVVNGYFLINEAEPESKTISLTIPPGNYDTISFMLGVDSARNMSGAQTGALDPLHDMFWTWNTGYVMAKLEGSSPLSKLPHHLIEYHIGGYRHPHAVQQVVSLPVKTIQVKSNNTLSVAIHADINQWFSGKHSLKIAEQAACTMPGALAVKYASNYAAMFSIPSTAKP